MKDVIREPACRALFFSLLMAFQFACSAQTVETNSGAANTDAVAPEAVALVAPATVAIPAGEFIMGSDAAEREYGYTLDEAAYGHSRTRTGRWYDSERNRTTVTTDAFDITTTPITNAQYQSFIAATSHPAPDVDQQTWAGYGLIHPYDRTRRHAWTNNQPPTGRDNHPVVMATYEDATAYAEWLSQTLNENWRLPTEAEWEKAVRGNDGNIFPWGNTFDSAKLNSHDAGPFDTLPVGQQSSPGPYGLLDGAGQVFEWILTPEAQRAWVKGGSWDDSGCGVCRPAARHSRPKSLRHILIGFRLVRTS